MSVAASQVPVAVVSIVVGEEGVCEPHGGLGESDALALELVGVGRRVVEDDALRLLALPRAEGRVENLRIAICKCSSVWLGNCQTLT